MTRIIGIQHRIKLSAAGEARPTRVFIAPSDENASSYELADEQAELDFVMGRFPVSYRAVADEEDLSGIAPWHLKTRKLKDGETCPEAHLRVVEKTRYRVAQVPAAYDGIQDGDTVVMILGGSGDYLASAAGRVAAKKGGKVMRIAPFVFKKEREAAGAEDKEQDAKLLAKAAAEKPELFYEVADRDQALILVRERKNLRVDTMKARIACEQRLRQRVIGNIFTSPDGIFPEGGVEKAFDDLKASDPIYKSLCQEELRAERELTKALEALDVYREIFKPVTGMGPMIAARIIASTIDIRRFPKASKFVAFSGVHVLKDGTFARRRNNQVANWSGDIRQSFFLFADQCNRRPDSQWGKYLLATKARLRVIHPEVELVDSKAGGGKKVKRYTDGHIHKMALWRTVTRFAERLYKDWTRFERETRANSAQQMKKAA